MEESLVARSFFQTEISKIIVNNQEFFYQFSFEHIFPLIISIRKFIDKNQTIENIAINPKEIEFIKAILTGSDKDLVIKKNGHPGKTYYDALTNLTNDKLAIEKLLDFPISFKGSLDLVNAFTKVNPSMGWMINRGFRSNYKSIKCTLHALLIIINEINRINAMYN